MEGAYRVQIELSADERRELRAAIMYAVGERSLSNAVMDVLASAYAKLAADIVAENTTRSIGDLANGVVHSTLTELDREAQAARRSLAAISKRCQETRMRSTK